MIVKDWADTYSDNFYKINYYTHFSVKKDKAKPATVTESGLGFAKNVVENADGLPETMFLGH